MPTPYWPIAGSVSAVLAAGAAQKTSGSWIRMPAPSPCNGSAPVAPRWRQVLEDPQTLRDDARGSSCP